MSNAEDRSRSIDEIAKNIVVNDPSNGKGRPGKGRPRDSILKRPVIWVLALVIIGIVLAVTLRSSPSGGGHKTGKGKTESFTGYVCHGTQITLFSNINSDAVSNGASKPSFSTHGKPYCLMYIQTYHWNKGTGSPPGTVGLVRVSGPAALAKSIASLPAKASDQNGVSNVNWYATVSITKPVILDGTYSCTDSDPATWSSDTASGGAGFCLVYANLAIPGG
jgi:hypothetical protein